MPVWVDKASAQGALAGMIRHAVEDAAENTVLSKKEQGGMSDFLRRCAAAERAEKEKYQRVMTDDVIDRAMSRAMTLWGKYNPQDGSRDARYLSQEEMRSIEKEDPALGKLTLRAYQIVAGRQTVPADASMSATAFQAHVEDYLRTQMEAAMHGARIDAPDEYSEAQLDTDLDALPSAPIDDATDDILWQQAYADSPYHDAQGEVVPFEQVYVGRLSMYAEWGGQELYAMTAFDRRTGEVLEEMPITD